MSESNLEIISEDFFDADMVKLIQEICDELIPTGIVDQQDYQSTADSIKDEIQKEIKEGGFEVIIGNFNSGNNATNTKTIQFRLKDGENLFVVWIE